MDRKQYLTLEQNICGARVFLNVFGLILENVEEINEFSKLKIFNTKGEEVGMLYFENGKVIIEADSNFGKIDASYDIADVFGFKDLECGGVFAKWNNTINYEISSEDKLNFKGDIQIGCTMDTEFGIRCNIHAMIEYIKDNKNIKMKFMTDGHGFIYNSKNDEEREELDIRPFDDFDGFIHHQIDDFARSYTKYCGIQPSSEMNDVELRKCWFIKENKKWIDYSDEYIKSVGKRDSEESSIQKGLLMKEIDPDFFKKIEEIKNTFKVEDVSLFENLVDVSFAGYTDKEVEALFGFERKKS